MISSSLTLAGLLLVGCGKSEQPPKILEVVSDRSSSAIRQCVASREGKRLFAGLSSLAGPTRGPAGSYYMLVASDGTWIQIYAEMSEPNAIVVRSRRPLSDAQLRFLRECAA